MARHKGQTPDEAGFDEHFMKIDSDSAGYADPVVFSDGSKPERRPGEYGPDLFYDHIAGFMERHRDRPFFVYYPMFLTHFDFTPTPDSPEWAAGDRLEKHPRFFADMVVYMDKNVGRIVAKLDELGLREKTLVIYLADNGTHPAIVSRMGEREVRGEKGLLTPAGTHVPLIVNWAQLGRTLSGREKPRRSLFDPPHYDDPSDDEPVLVRLRGVRRERSR